MGEHSTESVEKHVRIYKQVFLALTILTVVTVACSYLSVPFWLGILIGLAIALFKGSLVAAFFMHLVWEKKVIFGILILTALSFIGMISMILWHGVDVPVYR